MAIRALTREDEIIALLIEIRDLLGAGRPPAGASPRAAARQPKDERGTQDAVERLLAARNDHETWHPVWDHGKPLDKWLATLAVAEEEMESAVALTGPEIAKILTTRFRVPGVHATNVNRDLRNARGFVNRRKRGAGFEYSLTRRGLTSIKLRRDELAK